MDLYAVLGLAPGASIADIKRAYRRLARRYHPGINPGDRTAEALFHRITEAYETLTDPARREQYEAGGKAPANSQTGASFEFAGFDFTVAAHGAQAATFTELFAEVLHPVGPGDSGRPEAGADLHATLSVTFLESMSGAQRQVVVTRQDMCQPCRGTGSVATPEGRCPHCHATGSVRWARGHMVFSKSCAACNGTGRQRHQRCGVCGAHGRVVRTEGVSLRVPPGTVDGTRVRIPEKGHAGRHGGRTGDLYVVVHVAPHPLFRREGDDLHIEVPVAVHEAVLGARIEVPSLDGPFRLTLPPGTQGGRQFRVSGRGAPTLDGGRGDLIVHARLVLPPEVDEPSRELMREFGRRNNDNVRKNLKT
ncbi:MAG TPA: J domain-containing protein [Vicinamibacterales bacterium]|nr:J domain-containing protein [Vicinamibacterales bacterium]